MRRVSTSTAPAPGIFSRHHLRTTVGTTALVFLTAFESLAVTTVMPIVSADLDGRGAYATAFSATLAASVLGMVVAGGWADRRGPARPLLAAVATFGLGLLAASLAPTMGAFVAARFLQGLGAGGISVTLYVVVALVYPPPLRPAVFGVFASAWVLPSLVGPPLAGLVAESIGWPWVFSGVLVLVLAAAALVLPTVLRIPAPAAPARAGSPGTRFALAAGVAVAVVGLSSAGSTGPARWAVAALALAVLVVCVRPLLPRGTLSAQHGMPATVALRGLLAATFYSTEVYLPLMLHERFGVPVWGAGVVLTAAAVSWASASAVQGRLGHRLPHALAVRIGTVALLAGVLVQVATAVLSPAGAAGPAAAAAGWFVAGLGMGFAFPRTTVLVLELSPAGAEGAGSAALNTSDAAGGATALALTGLLFGAFSTLSGWAAFAGTLPLCALLAVLALLVARRVRLPAAHGVAAPVSQGTH